MSKNNNPNGKKVEYSNTNWDRKNVKVEGRDIRFKTPTSPSKKDDSATDDSDD